jgi:CBS domain-containing protein
MMKIKDILLEKGPEVFTIGADKTLDQAIKVLALNRVGALLVLDSSANIVGMLSERDIIRTLHSSPNNFFTLPVRSVMTKHIIVIEPEDDTEYAESIMTDNHIRHLPVLHDKALVGIISIGDIVKATMGSIRADNKYLMDYISGNFK